MTDRERSKSPQSADFKLNEPGAKIVDLNTLRALQKAAKQLNSRTPQNKEPTISITDNNLSPEPPKKNNMQDNASVQLERASTSDLKTKRSKTPEEEYAYTVRSKFQQALSKLYASETKDLVISHFVIIF